MDEFVSIIIPCYNHKNFLPKRLESVFSQTFQDFEVILLDDCSTDGSWELLKGFDNHPKVSYCIRNEVNSGSPFKQWEKGILLAKYNIIWIAESDDYCRKDFLEKMVVRFQFDTQLVYSNSHYINIDDNLIKSKFPNWSAKDNIISSRWNSDYFNYGINEISTYLCFRNTIVNSSSVLFRKPSKFPLELLSMKYCGDWYFWIYQLKSGNINYCHEKLNYFRAHEDSSRSINSMNDEVVRIKEISKCIQFARNIASIKYPRLIDFVNYSYLTKYYAWNYSELKLPRYFLIYLPWFLIPVLIFNYIHHKLRKLFDYLCLNLKLTVI